LNSDPIPKVREAITQRGGRCASRSGLCPDNDIDRWQQLLVQSKRLAHTAAQLVSCDASAHGFHGHGEPQARMRQIVRFHANRKVVVVETARAPRVDRVKVETRP
jgi:hypothetical protein